MKVKEGQALQVQALRFSPGSWTRRRWECDLFAELQPIYVFLLCQHANKFWKHVARENVMWADTWDTTVPISYSISWHQMTRATPHSTKSRDLVSCNMYHGVDTKTELILPRNKQDCIHIYGELYVWQACDEIRWFLLTSNQICLRMCITDMGLYKTVRGARFSVN